MKRFTLIFLCFVFLALPANSYNLSQFSDDYKVIDALAILEKNGGDEIIENLIENSVRIVFYDLSLLSYSYRNHYAISGENNLGQRFILINTVYLKSSVEEIACLIAHESCHKSKFATLSEETIATETEAKYWIKLKDKTKKYNESDLLNRLDELASLYKQSTPEENKIEDHIAGNEFYRKQLALD